MEKLEIIRQKPALFDFLIAKIESRLGPEVEEGAKVEAGEWPKVYYNTDTRKDYTPHNEGERLFVENDSPRYGLIRGGEGAGKSVGAVIKDLNRLRRGMSGIMVSPDFEHFKKSLWPEFQRWCPITPVLERERFRLRPDWTPNAPFALHFKSENGIMSTLHCGGIEDPSGWRGPNVNFAHFDEASRHETPAALKVLDGRIRIPGPHGEPPQLYISTTPKKHWLFDYFGPLFEGKPDPLESFKRDSMTIKLSTKDNEDAGNLAPGYTAQRGQTLTEAEKRVLLEAEWEDIDDTGRFLSSIIWWDSCLDHTALEPNAPMVFGVDAAVSNDCFGVVGVGAHPALNDTLIVGYAKAWEPHGEPLDFQAIKTELRQLCQSRNVLMMVYDPSQLHDMMSGFQAARTVETESFSQGAERLVADKALRDIIMERRVRHNGDPILRQHIDNADVKIGSNQSMRIVKRSDGLKVDLTVALSMAAKKANELFFSGASLGTGLIQGSARRKLSRLG